jgi:hypothetical protein
VTGVAAWNRQKDRGFWSGVLVGILLGLCLVLGLALVFPPFVFEPPRLPEAAATPPGQPAAPAGGLVHPAPSGPATPVLPPTAPGPLIDAGAEPEPPRLERTAPAPSTFGGAGGSPSLVPPAGR